jgi:hypothetical protein
MRFKHAMKLLLVPALAALLLAAPPVRATPLDDRIAELKHAVQKEAAARANGVGNPGFGNPGMNPAFINANIDQIVAQMENPAYGNMEAQLAQITSMYTSTEVQEATTNLLNELKKERKEKTDAEIASVNALLTRAGTAITQAKKPEDLDGLIEEMSKHANNQYGGNSALQGDQQLLRQFSSAYEFVKQWQNYLAHLASGQIEEARADLQNLSQNNEGAELMPRSKLLALTAPDKLAAMANKTPALVSPPAAQAQALLDGMKSLDDMEPTLKKLEPLRQNNTGVQMAANELSPMVELYENLKAGLPVQANMSFGYRASEANVPAAIRTQLVLFTLQSRFTAFKGTPPAPGEKPVDYVDRVIADATSRQDWDLLRSAASARATLTPNSGIGYANYPGGIDNIIAGAHLETAGQFALAVRAYEQALQGNDPAIPAKILGDKLAAIQRDHPKEFADGMQLTVNPPAPRYPAYPGRLPGGAYPVTPAPAPAAPPAK